MAKFSTMYGARRIDAAIHTVDGNTERVYVWREEGTVCARAVNAWNGARPVRRGEAALAMAAQAGISTEMLTELI